MAGQESHLLKSVSWLPKQPHNATDFCPNSAHRTVRSLFSRGKTRGATNDNRHPGRLRSSNCGRASRPPQPTVAPHPAAPSTAWPATVTTTVITTFTTTTVTVTTMTTAMMAVTMTTSTTTSNTINHYTNEISKTSKKKKRQLRRRQRQRRFVYCDEAVSIPGISACFGSIVNRHSFKASPR